MKFGILNRDHLLN